MKEFFTHNMRYNPVESLIYVMLIIVFICGVYFAFAEKEFRGYYLRNNQVYADWTNYPDQLTFYHTDINVVLQVYTALKVQETQLALKKGMVK